MQIKAILFDLDGTLVNSNDMHVEAWHQAFAQIGKKFNHADIHDQIGKGADMLVPTLMPETDDVTQKKLGEAEGKIFKAKFIGNVRPFPRAHDLLAHVHAFGQQVVLATSSSEEQVDHYLGLLDARDLVAATTDSGDVRATKPAPDIFAVALKKLSDISPSEALAVGDSPYDVEAARKNGIGTVALRSGGFSDEALAAAGAIAIYDDVAALLAEYHASPLGVVKEMIRRARRANPAGSLGTKTPQMVLIERGRAVATRHDRDSEDSGFSGFQLSPTKRQAST